MNCSMRCTNHQEFSHRQGCIFTDFHLHDESGDVQFLNRRRLPANPIRRICRLQNKNGFFLTMSQSGEVKATKNINDPFS